MLDKKIIKKNFTRCVATYNSSAKVQLIMAEKLVMLLKEKGMAGFASVLEVGAGTGILTSLMLNEFSIDSYIANDIIDNYHQLLENIAKDIKFIDGDIEDIVINQKFDLIIANAVFQWIDNLDILFEKLKCNMNENSLLAFSTFSKDNFCEVKDVLGVSLGYLDKETLYSILVKYFKTIVIVEFEEKLFFDSFKDILQHIKDTGANNLGVTKLSKSKLGNMEIQARKYAINDKLPLTYKPLLIICSVE